MADTARISDQLIILKNQDNWDQWIEQLQAMVTPTAWKKFIDPDSDKPPARPIIDNEEPIESAYSATYTAAVRRAENEQSDKPEYNRVQYDLTSKERDEFKFDLEVY